MRTRLFTLLGALSALALIAPAHASMAPSATVGAPLVQLAQYGGGYGEPEYQPEYHPSYRPRRHTYHPSYEYEHHEYHPPRYQYHPQPHYDGGY